MNELNIDPAVYDAIARQIASEESVVGIDAKKTHILILHLLMEMQKGLERMEARLAALESR